MILKLAQAIISGVQSMEAYSDRPHIPRPHRGTDISGINTSKSAVSASSGMKPKIQKLNDVCQI